MMMNPRYKIVVSTSMTELERQVEIWLKIGWRFVGGVCVVRGMIDVTYYQAMSFGVSNGSDK